ncbi:MAG: type II/IV secretion system protein [Candidatus Vogelbacteria bacterium]|nr:type II/IV secretion system protein [Candidatus Vogelbacteria bacterium]
MPFDDTLNTKKIDDLKLKEAEELAQILAARYKLIYADLSRTSINTDALKVIDEELARRSEVAAFQLQGKELSLAVLSPHGELIPGILEDLSRDHYKVTMYMVSPASLKRAWDRYKEVSDALSTKAGLIEISSEHLKYFMDKIHTVVDLQEHIEEIVGSEKEQGQGISKILEIILAGAIAVNSSDIHFEPQETTVRLRFRLDGVLHDISDFKKEIYLLLLSRVKLISGLKLNVKQSAQDGRLTINLDSDSFEIRTSVLPGGYGESIVLRILNPASLNIALEDMGFGSKLLDILNKEILKPNGMVLVTGPTGSGKSTTLYACLKKINDPAIKIITIEDPIEYHVKGIEQTQVNDEKGYTFLEGLRSVLRQDPDVIMIGEIRDTETAKIAINSSLTGHLVFSTLHTNDAAGSYPRLIDLGVNPKVITSAISISIAQRLVRRLCQTCKVAVAPSADQWKIIQTILSGIAPETGEKIPTVEKVWVPPADGKTCGACHGIGYKGRIGLFEAIISNKAVETAIINNPSERDIVVAARPQGILDMRQDGVLKVLKGITSVEELDRVVDLYGVGK